MSARRLMVSTMLVAGFCTACTAIVLGKIGETGDYAESPSPGTSTADECSLLSAGYGVERDANACSECIAESCADDVEYACNRGDKSEGKKTWFGGLRDCAQSPWLEYEPPGSGASSYGCRRYDQPDAQPIGGDSDSARQRQAELCVRDNCLKGDLPACKLCEVHTKKTGTSETAFLRDDPCGSCLSENCMVDIVRCCNGQSIREFVTACAFTDDPEKKLQCKRLAEVDPGYSGSERACFDSLSACFTQHCMKLPACK